MRYASLSPRLLVGAVVFVPRPEATWVADAMIEADQKFVKLCSSQHYSLVENSMYRSVFPSPGVEDGVFLPSSPRASEAFAGHDESDACGISGCTKVL